MNIRYFSTSHLKFLSYMLCSFQCTHFSCLLSDVSPKFFLLWMAWQIVFYYFNFQLFFSKFPFSYCFCISFSSQSLSSTTLRSLAQTKHIQHELCVCSLVSNSLNPVDCSPPGCSVHGTSQVRILKWVAISSSRGTE